MRRRETTTNTNQNLEPPILNRKRVWNNSFAILGVIVGLLLLIAFVMQSSLHAGWTTYDYNYSDHGQVEALATDKNGRVWAVFVNKNSPVFGVNSGTIVRYSDDDEPIWMPIPNELTSYSIYSMAIDSQDQIWIVGANRVVGVRDTEGNWILYTSENIDEKGSIYDIEIDDYGQAWTTIGSEGLRKMDLDNNKKIYALVDPELADNDIYELALDENGKLWALGLSALRVLNPNGSWAIYASVPDGIRGDLVIDSQGRVWIDTSFLDVDNTWQFDTLDDGGWRLYSGFLVADHQGRVWALGSNGLFRFDPTIGWTSYNSHNSGLDDGYHSTLAIDSRGRVWIDSFDDLIIFDPQEALPPQTTRIFSVATIFIPATSFSIGWIMVLVFAFMRPGAISRKNIFNFCIGFIGWFLINSLSVLVFADMFNEYTIFLFIGFQIIANIIILVWLSVARGWMALGILSAVVFTLIGQFLVNKFS